MAISALAYRVTPSETGVGVALETEDLEALAGDPDFIADLQGLLDRLFVVRLRSETTVSPKALHRLARGLGLPEGPYQGRPGAMEGYEFIGDFSAKARDDDGRERTPTFIESLHYDIYGGKPASYAFSHTRSIPETTPQLFVDMRAAYADLPPALKAKVDGATALHGLTPLPSQPLSMAPPFDREKASRRPLVIAHPRTGEPLLFLPKHPGSLVEGMAAEEGLALLHDLWDRVHASPNRFQAPMRSNDLVIWDNLGVTHTNPAYPRGIDRTVWFFTLPSAGPVQPYS